MKLRIENGSAVAGAVLFVLSVAFATLPKRATACLPIPHCVDATWTVPPAGAVDVPLNTELEAMPFGALAGVPRTAVALALRVADTGEEVILVDARTRGRRRPDSPLLPETRYELYAPTSVSRSPFGMECATEPTVLVASFTTGTTTDETAPTGVTAAATGCGTESCDDGACCGPYVARLYGARWSATDDGALPVAYAFGSPDGPRTLATMGTAVSHESGFGRSPFWIDIPGASPVYALDAAGNVSLDSADFMLGCAPPPPEPPEPPPEPPAPVEPPVDESCDGGTCPTTMPMESSDGSGCTVTSAPCAPRGSFALLLLSAAMLAMRRRRSARR